MKRQLIIIAIVLLVAVAGILVVLWRTAEPSYQGYPLSHWLELRQSVLLGSKSRQSVAAITAETAIREIGTNALPTLIKMLQAHDSPLKASALKWINQQQLLKVHLTSAKERRLHARFGYEPIGSNAVPQIPQLIQVLTNGTAEVREDVCVALGYIGPEAKAATPALISATRDPQDNIRNNALWALSRIQPPVDLVLPALIQALDDPLSVARENAAIALMHYGPLAKSAIPALVRTQATNRVAASALIKIDAKTTPEAKEK